MCGTKVTPSAEGSMQNCMEIDNWLEFEFPTPQVMKLRQYIDSYIHRKLQNPLNVATKSDDLALVTLGNILEIEDQNVGLPWPDGIDQRPKFLNYNIMQDSQYDNWRGDGISNQRPITSRPYSTNSSRNQGRQYGLGNHIKNIYPVRRQDPVGAPAGFLNTNPSNWRQRNGITSHIGNGFNNFNSIHQHPISNLPSLDTLSIAHTSSTSALNSHQPEQVPVVCPMASPPLPILENSVFLLIRVKLETSILIAYDTEKWTFSPQTEKTVISMDNVSITLSLFFQR